MGMGMNDFHSNHLVGGSGIVNPIPGCNGHGPTPSKSNPASLPIIQISFLLSPNATSSEKNSDAHRRRGEMEDDEMRRSTSARTRAGISRWWQAGEGLQQRQEERIP